MMYRKYFITLILLILVLCSCNKQEVFSPSQHIETESKSNENGGMDVVKRFTYTDKQLTSVWLAGDVTLTFEYNNDKTIKRINSSEKENTYALLSYENKQITQIEYYEENNLAREIIFGRKDGGKTINKVEKYVYDGFFAKSMLSDMLFPETKSLPESVLKSRKSAGKSLYSVENVTYEGDNIQRVRWYSVKDEERTLQTETTYKYDDKKNPYYGLPYAFLELSGYNKNNITSTMVSYEHNKGKEGQIVLVTIENSYSYDKKYPVSISIAEHKTYFMAYEAQKNPIYQTDTKNHTTQYAYK